MAAQRRVGRDRELGLLGELTDRALSGHGQLLLIEGEPGIGKTSLLKAVLDSARKAGARVVIGAAEELDQQLPFAAIANYFGADRLPSEG